MKRCGSSVEIAGMRFVSGGASDVDGVVTYPGGVELLAGALRPMLAVLRRAGQPAATLVDLVATTGPMPGLRLTSPT